MNSYTAFLRVRHPSIDPGEITRVLGLEPAHAWAAGSPRGGAGAAAESARGAHAQSYWFAPLGESIWRADSVSPGPAAGARGKALWQATSRALPLEAFLLSRIRLLTPHRGFFARINTEGGSCELAVTLAGRDRLSLELPPSLLRSLGELNIAIALEVSTGEEPVAH